MRPTRARVLLSVIAIGALATGALTALPIFFVVALGAGVLLGTSLSTSRRPLTHALERFRDRAVEVRLWGAPPPNLCGPTLVLTAVNSIGAGAHVFFKLHGSRLMHLKVAQPRDPSLTVDSVVIGSARYVQWNGKRLPRVGSAPAVAIALCEAPMSGRAGSVA